MVEAGLRFATKAITQRRDGELAVIMAVWLLPRRRCDRVGEVGHR
jgi:hypothetical protein